MAAISTAACGSSQFAFSSIAIPTWYMDFSSLRLVTSNYHAYLHVHFVVNNLLYVNFFWSLLNLFPVFLWMADKSLVRFSNSGIRSLVAFALFGSP